MLSKKRSYRQKRLYLTAKLSAPVSFCHTWRKRAWRISWWIWSLAASKDWPRRRHETFRIWALIARNVWLVLRANFGFNECNDKRPFNNWTHGVRSVILLTHRDLVPAAQFPALSARPLSIKGQTLVFPNYRKSSNKSGSSRDLKLRQTRQPNRRSLGSIALHKSKNSIISALKHCTA